MTWVNRKGEEGKKVNVNSGKEERGEARKGRHNGGRWMRRNKSRT